METIFVDIYNDGPMGARVETEGLMPSFCPGMGGWKRKDELHYFTRIKGEMGDRILRAFGHGGFGELSMDAQGIVGMEPYK